jgi:hypothetical protein
VSFIAARFPLLAASFDLGREEAEGVEDRRRAGYVGGEAREHRRIEPPVEHSIEGLTRGCDRHTLREHLAELATNEGDDRPRRTLVVPLLVAGDVFGYKLVNERTTIRRRECVLPTRRVVLYLGLGLTAFFGL